MSDLISRQQAIKAIEDLHGYYGFYNMTIYDVINKLKNLPPAQPEQAIGKWIDTDNYYQRWKCSVCGCHTRDAKPPYCSNCGKKMKEE